MKYFALFFILLSALGCVSKKKLQQIAIEQYPIKDSLVIHRDTIHDTLDIPPLEITIRDTIDCPPADTLRRVATEKKTIVPARKVVIEIPTVDTTSWLRYTAIEEILKDELAACKDEVYGLRKDVVKWQTTAEERQAQAKSSGKWFWWFLLTALALVGSTAFRLLGNFKI